MKNSFIAVTVASLLLLSGCGDEKSAGEKMADAVSTIKGDKPVVVEPIVENTNPESDVPSSEAVVEKAEAIEGKIEENAKEVTEEPKSTLKDIAEKATEEIKELTEPAQEVVESAKDVAIVATESVKEVAAEATEAAAGKIAAATAAVTAAVAPVISDAKEVVNEKVSKAADLFTFDSGNIAKGQKLYLKKMKKACGMNGAEFAGQHTQEEWDQIRKDGTFAEEAMKLCPDLKKVREKWIPDIWQFSYEYASDSGNVPSC